MEALDFLSKNITQNQPHVSFTTVWQYWLGIAKLFSNPFQQVKISYLTKFLITDSFSQVPTMRA